MTRLIAPDFSVVRIDPRKKTASILSFPRDLYLPIAGTGKSARINSAHAHGVQTLIDTIQQGFGVPINHYVEVDFVGFQKLVDAVGGIKLWFDTPVRDQHSGLLVENTGCVTLNGEDARPVRGVDLVAGEGDVVDAAGGDAQGTVRCELRGVERDPRAVALRDPGDRLDRPDLTRHVRRARHRDERRASIQPASGPTNSSAPGASAGAARRAVAPVTQAAVRRVIKAIALAANRIGVRVFRTRACGGRGS